MTHTAEDVARSRMRFHVTHELTEQELEGTLVQRRLDLRVAHPLTFSLAAPQHLVSELHAALKPLGQVLRDGDADADIRIIALPGCSSELLDIPELEAAATPILPIRFDQFSVTVGPLMDVEGPCPTCTLPAILNGATKPAEHTQAQLFAAAASSCAWYVRAFDAHASSATSLSVTIDSRTPRIEHRLWACLPGCRRERAA